MFVVFYAESRAHCDNSEKNLNYKCMIGKQIPIFDHLGKCEKTQQQKTNYIVCIMFKHHVSGECFISYISFLNMCGRDFITVKKTIFLL